MQILTNVEKLAMWLGGCLITHPESSWEKIFNKLESKTVYNDNFDTILQSAYQFSLKEGN